MAHTSNLAGTSRTDYTELVNCLAIQEYAWAIHTLACDRCKQGVCRPGEGDTVPMAIRMLQQDANKGVCQMAAGMLGPSVHRSSEARDCSRKKVVVQRDNKACYRSRKSVARKKCGSNAGSEGIVNQEHDY